MRHDGGRLAAELDGWMGTSRERLQEASKGQQSRHEEMVLILAVVCEHSWNTATVKFESRGRRAQAGPYTRVDHQVSYRF